MTYVKPDDLKYTDMAIYIDTHIYNNTYEEHLVYEYLYHLSTMLAYKFGYFEHGTDYDNFGIYCASRYYSRLLNSTSSPIKSILNYIKRTINLVKIDYCNENSSHQYGDTNDESETFSMRNILIDRHSELAISNFRLSLDDIGKTCRKTLSQIPVKRNSSEWRNIYISCLLTFINSITLPENYVFEGKRETTIDRDYNSQDNIILYHLDDSMRSYIKGLVTRMKFTIGEDLSSTLNEYIYIDDMCKYGVQETSDEY